MSNLVFISDYEIFIARYMAELRTDCVTQETRDGLITAVGIEFSRIIEVINVIIVGTMYKLVNKIITDDPLAYVENEFNLLGLNDTFCSYDFVEPLAKLLLDKNVYHNVNVPSKVKYLSKLFDLIQTCPVTRYRNGVILLILRLMVQQNMMDDGFELVEKINERIKLMSNEDRASAEIPSIIILEK